MFAELKMVFGMPSRLIERPTLLVELAEGSVLLNPQALLANA